MATESFWASIGRPRYISAPMVEQSSLPWRHLVRRHGVDLCFTQMFNARVFCRSETYRREMLDFVEYRSDRGEEYEKYAQALDRPLIAQLAGDDAQVLVQAGLLIVQHNVSAIDLNLGCPQQIAKRGHYGAYLLPERDLVLRILSEMVEKLPCPVTAKIRRLPSDGDTVQLARDMERVGVQMITVHGRFVAQSKQFTGPADWQIIRRVKEAVSVPVVANGGVGSLADAQRCLEETGADAVLASEGLLENPKLFCPKGDEEYRSNFIHCQLSTAEEFLSHAQSFPTNFSRESPMRAHLFKMLHRFLSAPRNHDLRNKLAKCSLSEMDLMVKELRRRMDCINSDVDLATQQELLSSTHWYMRHRDETAHQRIFSKQSKKALQSE